MEIQTQAGRDDQFLSLGEREREREKKRKKKEHMGRGQGHLTGRRPGLGVAPEVAYGAPGGMGSRAFTPNRPRSPESTPPCGEENVSTVISKSFRMRVRSL